MASEFLMDGNEDELDGMSARLLWEAYGPRDVFEAIGRSFGGGFFWMVFGRGLECAEEALSLVVSRAVLSFIVGFWERRESSLLGGMVEGFGRMYL
jgi:hypothetical protein